mgnify:FL=1
MRRRLLILFGLTFQYAISQTVGKYAGEFLAIGVGGRALGLGGAYTALANDATAGYWNPGALVRINYPEITLMHDERFGGLFNYDFASVALPYGPDVSLGISLIRLGVDNIPDTRNAGIDANGNPLPADQWQNFVRLNNDKITYFSSADWAMYFTYSKKVDEAFSYGANVKFVRRSLGDHSATGIGFDIGLLYSPFTDFYLGVNAQDVTTTLVSWSTGRNELISPTIKLGTAYFFDMLGGRFAPTVDVDIRFENRRFASIAHIGPISFDPHVGLEYELGGLAALRLGYNDVKQVSFGAGVHLRRLDIDYSFARVQNRELGDTHRISLRLIFQEDRFARGPE